MATAAPDAERFLADWHEVVARRDLPALAELLSPDVTLATPPYWQDFEGLELVHFLLGLVLEAIEGFTYHREWLDGGELALEFRGRVGDVELQGIDLIRLDAEGRVRRLDVLIRPENAIAALRERIRPRMVAFLAERSGA